LNGGYNKTNKKFLRFLYTVGENVNYESNYGNSMEIPKTTK
jgi:hypothetical protein